MFCVDRGQPAAEELHRSGLAVAGGENDGASALLGRQPLDGGGHVRGQLLPAEPVGQPLRQLGDLALAALDLGDDPQRRAVGGGGRRRQQGDAQRREGGAGQHQQHGQRDPDPAPSPARGDLLQQHAAAGEQDDVGGGDAVRPALLRDQHQQQQGDVDPAQVPVAAPLSSGEKED